MTPTLPPSVAKAFPQLNDALQALSKPATIAEIEAVWWSDGLEIWSGQAAAKHVNGFNSLFGHQARVVASTAPAALVLSPSPDTALRPPCRSKGISSHHAWYR
jgi:hypothetical protein